MKASAFVPVVKYSEAGLKLLGCDCWKREYALALNLTSLAATGEYSSGKFYEMQTHVNDILSNAHSFDDKIAAYITQIRALSVRAQFDEGITIAIQVLKNMGLVSLPTGTVCTTTILVALLRTNRLLRKHTKESLSNLPIEQNEKRILGGCILELLSTMAYISRPDLLPLIILTLVQWAVQFGVTKYSSGGFALYGCLLCGKLGNPQRGFMFGEVALATIKRQPARDTIARTMMIVYMMVHHWIEDAKLGNTPFLYGHQVGFETGDIESALFCLDFHGVISWFMGTKLEKVEEGTKQACALMKEHNQSVVLNYSLVRWQCVLNLQGHSVDPVVLTGTAMRQEEMRKTAIHTRNRVLEVVLDSYRMVLAYMFRHYRLAMDLAERVLDIENILVGHFTSTRIIFYACLTSFAAANPKTKLGRHHKKIGFKLAKKLRSWAQSGTHFSVSCVLLLFFY